MGGEKVVEKGTQMEVEEHSPTYDGYWYQLFCPKRSCYSSST